MRKKSQISIRDIARELGLNISTVSRALNRSYRVSKETTEMVLRKAHEMGYHFQKINKNIVILLPSPKVELAWYSINMINALQGRLKDTDYLWEFINEDNIRIIQERSVSGIISLGFTQHIAQKISNEYNIPLICINNASSFVDNVYSVNSDAENAIRLAFKCLYEYGHRNIAFVSSSRESFAGKKRISALAKSIEEYGLNDKSLVVTASPQSCNHGLVLDLYQKGITGIIADGESSGLKIWNSLNYCKIAVPKKMSLITWEMPYVSQLVYPAITTVEQDFKRIAEKAIYLLEMRLRNEKITMNIDVPYQLHLRDTVSIPYKGRR